MASTSFTRGLRIPQLQTRQYRHGGCVCLCHRHTLPCTPQSFKQRNFTTTRHQRASVADHDDDDAGATHYDILNLRSDASKQQIKASFYALSKRHHPDVAATGNARRFQRINEAYAVLKEDRTRRDYDRTLSTTTTSSSGGDDGGGGGWSRPSGLSRRKTRPQGPPPSWGASFTSANQADRPYHATGTGGFGDRPIDPARDTVQNPHFSYTEHKSRHARFDAKWQDRFAEERMRRGDTVGSPSSEGAFTTHPHNTSYNGGAGGENGGGGFFMALGLFSLIVVVSGVGASIRADSTTSTTSTNTAMQAAAATAMGRSTDTHGPFAFRHSVEKVDWHDAMRDAAARHDRRAVKIWSDSPPPPPTTTTTTRTTTSQDCQAATTTNDTDA